MGDVRVRIAPSPTGDGAHIGFARTTLFNWLFAKHHQGTFVLRSEDTDAERSKPEYEAAIQRDLEWLGLNWDEFYRQSDRVERHREVAQQLLESGAAYESYETPDEIQAQQTRAQQEKRNYVYEGKSRLMAEWLAEGGEKTQKAQAQIDTWKAEGRQPMLRFKIQDYAWDEDQNQWISLPKPAYREKLEQNNAVIVPDLIKGDTAYEFENPVFGKQGAVVSDLVILRADGTPTYNFAVVVDDMDMKISHIIRGDEHLNNTPKQMLIYAALDMPIPQFAHLPMILDKTKKKLSKRRSEMDVYISNYQKNGFLPEALVNFLARLGWSHGDQEIFSLEELIQAYSLEKVGLSAAVFDDEKLIWLNAHYIKTGDPVRLAELLRQQLVTDDILSESEAGNLSQEKLQEAVTLYAERASTLSEMAETGRFLFREDFTYDEKGVEKFIDADAISLLGEYAQNIEQASNYSVSGMETFTQDFLDRKEKKFKHLAQPARLALTGQTKGAGLFETLTFFAQQDVVKRLRRAMNAWQ